MSKSSYGDHVCDIYLKIDLGLRLLEFLTAERSRYNVRKCDGNILIYIKCLCRLQPQQTNTVETESRGYVQTLMQPSKVM
jgi:hypothetical protein